jgi:ubiquinone/menaquinone biosynthesis C-methylase UbiE
VLDNVLNFLDWDGRGTLLDIGCGSGAMTIKAAKKFPDAQVAGMDYWGVGWDYSQTQCESNARIEKVGDRVVFQKGDAAKLDFPDASFDAAVSNFVFHEVKSQSDKLALIREALRVIKPGGAFSFEDVFFSKTHYKDLDRILAELSKDVTEIHFVDTRNSGFVPNSLKTPLVIGEMGLIHGRK